MSECEIPLLSEQQFEDFINLAKCSKTRRHPKILHNSGDEFNSVFNFIMHDSYMQPHLHPGVEKKEYIHVVVGKLAVIFFGNQGSIEKITILENGGLNSIEVPAFTWHTYVMLSEYVVTYETMMGVYSPKTWKTMADWAPQEGSVKCYDYLEMLKSKVKSYL
jgi:cupin fold WbuC family metalloprotein